MKFELISQKEEQYGLSGWEVLHGDVFRKHKRTDYIAAFAGITAFFLALLGLSILSSVLPSQITDFRFAVRCFLFSFIAATALGGTSAGVHKYFGGKRASHAPAIASVFLFFPFSIPLFLSNIIGSLAGSSSALSIGDVIRLGVPIAGGYFGGLALSAAVVFKLVRTFKAPCRTNTLARPTPPTPWRAAPLTRAAALGLLTFLPMLREVRTILHGICHHDIQGIAGLALVILFFASVTVSLLSIVFTYLQLEYENHKWQWPSFLCGGTPALFIAAYGTYFYFASKMTGYLFVGTVTLFYVFGTVGFMSAFFFLRYIYSSLSFD